MSTIGCRRWNRWNIRYLHENGQRSSSPKTNWIPSSRKDIADYEKDLMDAVNSLGIGPMGTGGNTTVLAVNVEYAVVHTGALPVAVNIQCAIARRCVVQINKTGEIVFGNTPKWDYR